MGHLGTCFLLLLMPEKGNMSTSSAKYQTHCISLPVLYGTALHNCRHATRCRTSAFLFSARILVTSQRSEASNVHSTATCQAPKTQRFTAPSAVLICRLCKCKCRCYPRKIAPFWRLPEKHSELQPRWCNLATWSIAGTRRSCSKCSRGHRCNGHLWWAIWPHASFCRTTYTKWSHQGLCLSDTTSLSWMPASEPSVQTECRTSSSRLLRMPTSQGPLPLEELEHAQLEETLSEESAYPGYM